MDNRNINVRRAVSNDAKAIISSINVICAEENAFYTKHFISTPIWEAVLYNPDTVLDHLLVVAEWHGKYVGAGQLFPGSPQTHFHHVAELGVWVLQPYRRRGIGTQLMAEMLEWARQQAIEKIVLNVFSNNTPAIGLYHKFGFTMEGYRREQFKVADRYYDEILMAYFL